MTGSISKLSGYEQPYINDYRRQKYKQNKKQSFDTNAIDPPGNENALFTGNKNTLIMANENALNYTENLNLGIEVSLNNTVANT